MTLPDPKKGWREALLRIVVGEESYEGREAAGIAASFTPLLSMFPVIGIYGGLLHGSKFWVYVSAALWVAAVYLCYWRLYTRPRMPTIWEALVGYVLVLLMPIVSGARLLVGWVREAAEEAAEHDRGEP